jgi:HK97 family phage prohead protease
MSQHHLILKSNLALDRLEEEGSFSGYASVFDHVDQQKDRVIHGAFRDTLARDALPKMLWQHNPQEPIGVWQIVEEDHKGLYVQGQLLLDLQKAKEAHTLMKRGVKS